MELIKHYKRKGLKRTYALGHKIGSGTFSNVYEVTHRWLNKKFAAKAFVPGHQKEDQLSEQIIREIEVLKKISNPEYFPSFEGLYFEKCNIIIMDFVQGKTFGEMIKE